MGRHSNNSKSIMNIITSPAFRIWAYRVCSAVSAAIAVWGLIDNDAVSALNLVFFAVFGMASVNVDQRIDDAQS